MTKPSPGSGPAGKNAPHDTPPSTGNTRVSDDSGSRPRLPHERDESADSQADKAPVDDERARKAQGDVERGVVDTDRGPVIDQTYDRVKNS